MSRFAFHRAYLSASRALSASRVLPWVHPHRDNPNWVPPYPDLCDRVGRAVDRARRAIAPLTYQFRDIGWASPHVIAGRMHACAHEAATDAANELLFLFHPFCGGPFIVPHQEVVYLQLVQQLQKEHAAALMRLCRSAEPKSGPSDRTGQQPENPEPKRACNRSRGGGRAKLIAALTRHHRYADEGCLKFEPIGNNELAKAAGVSVSTASGFFGRYFQGYAKYTAVCRDPKLLATSLKMLNGEFAPHFLYGSRPPEEGDLDSE